MRDGDVVEVKVTGCEFKRVGEKQTRMCELMAQDDDGQELKVAIWLSEKAAGIARQQFKKIGFEIDKHELSRLAEFIKQKEPRVMVTIETREYGGNLYYQGAIEIDGARGAALPKDELDEATKWMRNAKKREDAETPAEKATEFSEADKAKARKAGVASKLDDDSIPF